MTFSDAVVLSVGACLCHSLCSLHCRPLGGTFWGYEYILRWSQWQSGIFNFNSCARQSVYCLFLHFPRENTRAALVGRGSPAGPNLVKQSLIMALMKPWDWSSIQETQSDVLRNCDSRCQTKQALTEAWVTHDAKPEQAFVFMLLKFNKCNESA